MTTYRDDARSLCLHCGGWINYDSQNSPPWTHDDTGYADCPDDDESYAEPDPNYITY